MLVISPVNYIKQNRRKVQKNDFSYIAAGKSYTGDIFVKTGISFGSSQEEEEKKGTKYKDCTKPDWLKDESEFIRIVDSIQERLSQSPEKSRSNSNIYLSPENGSRKKIFNALTENNLEYLNPILLMNKGKLDADTISDMLCYIDKTITENEKDPEKLREAKGELKTKIDFMVNLEGNLTRLLGEHLYREKISDTKEETFFDNIGNSTFPILLKRDILTTKDESSNFESTASKIAEMISSGKDWSKRKPENQKHVIAAQKFTAKHLGNIMLASTLMTHIIFNDFVYNSYKYSPYKLTENSIVEYSDIDDELFCEYSKKLNKMKQSDIEAMRYISKYAKESDEDTDKKLSISGVTRYFEIISTARSLINKGYLDEKDWHDENLAVQEDEKTYSFSINGMKLERTLIKPLLKSNYIDDDTIESYIKKYDEAVKKAGSADKIDRTKFWDVNHIYLLDGTKINPGLKRIIKEATELVAQAEDIDKLDMAQIYYDKTMETENNGEAFKDLGISFEKWLRPAIMPTTYEIKTEEDKTVEIKDIEKLVDKKPESETTSKNKKYTAQMWRRIPQESLFDGNYATCCTGIGKTEANSFIRYLQRGFSNLVEVRNERGEVKAFSRLYLGKVNDESAVIIDNIEINKQTRKKYMKDTPENAVEFRNMIYRYVQNFAKHITEKRGEPIRVYSTTKCPRTEEVFSDGLKPDNSQKEAVIAGSLGDSYINIARGSYSPQQKIKVDTMITDITNLDCRKKV